MSLELTRDDSQDQWPEADLETVAQCPVCFTDTHRLLHEALTDGAFGAAPGRWSMWRCARCGAGFLNPRPTAGSIMRAYTSYYTHAPAPARELGTGWRTLLENGYVNARYGTRLPQASWLGPWVFGLLPIRRSAIDRLHRHLPTPSGQARLLDVGCGDGAFLAMARDCGWQCLGVEPDPVAAERARQRGLEVWLGGLETLSGYAGRFDVITLSHVIEHVHKPVETLRACHDLLRPGGRIWIETPNLDSVGHRIYGKHWRGLETPRHLVMFNRGALLEALRAAGFVDVQDEPVPSSREATFRESEAIRMGQHPGLADSSLPPLPPGPARLCRHAHLTERWLGAPREFLTCSARRRA
jgi:SAM-dependent methyltransferase